MCLYMWAFAGEVLVCAVSMCNNVRLLMDQVCVSVSVCVCGTSIDDPHMRPQTQRG